MCATYRSALNGLDYSRTQRIFVQRFLCTKIVFNKFRNRIDDLQSYCIQYNLNLRLGGTDSEQRKSEFVAERNMFSTFAY